MAVYRLGDMVRMRREALGMTQDELIQVYDGTACKPLVSVRAKAGGEDRNEICSVQVLRRIENGGVKRVKMDVFRRLMKKMGLLPERIYASLLVTECRGLRLKTEIHVHMTLREYEEAEKKLQELEPMLVPAYPRNEQYLMAMRAKLSYEKKELEAGKYLDILLEALRYTVPMLDEIEIEKWPFNMNEFDILSDIVNVYHVIGEREKEAYFLTNLKKNVEMRYMDENHYVVWHARTLVGLSQLMCMEGILDKSMEYCMTGIEECKKQRILGSVFCFLFDIAWIRENRIRMGIFQKVKSPDQLEDAIKKERASCKRLLVQAYYLSVAQGDKHGAERIKELYDFFYPSATKLLV